MEPTGYYGADYMSAIYGADFCRTYTEPIPWSDIYGAGQTHMIPLRACGITGVTQWTVHYIKEKGKEMHACINTVHTHVAYMIEICSVIYVWK